MKSIIQKLNHSKPFFYANVLLLFVLINGVGAKLNLRLDLSSGSINSLSESTESVLSKIDDRILIEAYISQDLPGQILAYLGPIIGQLKEFERMGGDKVQYRLINPDTEEEREEAQKRGIEGIPISVSKVSESTVKLSYFGIYVQIGEKSTIIPLLNENQRGSDSVVIEDFEYQLLREIKRLSRKEKTSEIAIAQAPGLFQDQQPTRETGFAKDSIFVYKYFMEQERGKITDADLTKKIPENIKTLILAGLPRLEEKEIYNLDQFLMRGGSLVCLLKGFDFNLQPASPYMRYQGEGGSAFASVQENEVKQLNDWLEAYGVKIRPEILFEFEQATPTFDLDGVYMDRFRNPVWGLYTQQHGNLTSDHPALKDLKMVVLPWFSGLEITKSAQPGAEFSVLIQSSKNAISKTTSSLNVKTLHTMETEPGDKPAGENRIPLAVFAKGKFKSAFTADNLPPDSNPKQFMAEQIDDSKANLIVIGTPYLVSDILLQRQGNAEVYQYNQIFLTNLLESVSGDDELLAARSRVKVTNYLERTGEAFESLFKWFHILFLPAVLSIFGALRLMQRNKRLGIATVTASPEKHTNQESEKND